MIGQVFTFRSFATLGQRGLRLLAAGATAALLGGACGGNVVLPDQAPAEWTTCQTEGDCTLIEIGCCDHCNGGELFSVHKAHAAEALDAMKKKDCAGDCTALGCSDGVPTCEAGVCGFTIDGK